MAAIPELLGKILPDEVTARDAIHFAVIPVKAGCRLTPGQNVGKLSDGRFGPAAPNNIGIVDPFIQGRVSEDENFYLFLYPNTITALAHHWEHPAFPSVGPTPVAAPPDAGYSEQWLRAWCGGRGECSYEQLLESLDNWSGEDWLTIYGSDVGGNIDPAIWPHVEAVTGRQFPRPPAYFSCSC